MHLASDGKRYYLPLQYVMLYLYARQDWFAKRAWPCRRISTIFSPRHKP